MKRAYNKSEKEQKALLDKAIEKFGNKSQVSKAIGIWQQHFNRYYNLERQLPLDKYLLLRDLVGKK